ncbi:MAG: fatty acid desaturase family protein [Isosphaeraceae bacterium]
MIASNVERPTFEDPVLQRRLMGLRRVDNTTNLIYLAVEYLALLMTAGIAIFLAESREYWGLSWWWNVPVFTAAVVLIGGIQHRLAGLGHEAAHYSFMKNRLLNDLIPDLFCMFPLMSALHFYRVFHLGHHQFTNDPDRDPDLLNLGPAKRAGEFPMSRLRFIFAIYFCALVAPLRCLRYQWAYLQVNTLGTGRNVYVRKPASSGGPPEARIRLGTMLGIAYVFGFAAVLRLLTGLGQPRWIIPTGFCGMGLAALITYCLPDWAIYRSPFRHAYSPRFASAVRLSFYTTVLSALAYIRWATGGASFIYPILLWQLPLGTSFMFFMFLRDVYQHSNADTGRLTNSRVFFPDFFTRWAVFVYGQDMHVPHHLFPAVPHYRLRRLHELLKLSHAGYRLDVVEAHGTFHNHGNRRTILDEMTGQRPARPAAATANPKSQIRNHK